jgi:hypothetical protein
MRFKVIGIGDYKGKCVYEETEDILMVNEEPVLDFKKKGFEDFHRYAKFLINHKWGRAWISFQFIPSNYQILKRKFAIITASNPQNLHLNEFSNFLRNGELERAIRRKHFDYLTSIGELSHTLRYYFLVYEIPKREALGLARQFDQQSFFYNDGKSIAFIDTKSGEPFLYYDYLAHFKEKRGDR